MRTAFGPLWLGGCCLAVSLILVGCRNSRQDSGRVEYSPIATVKDVMDSIVDPSADAIWAAVATVTTAAGTEEKAPHTNDEWADVRRSAIRLVEAPNLLMMPGRHAAPPNTKSDNPDVELGPDAIDARINQDRAAWNRGAMLLRDISMDLLRAIDAKDRDKLFEASGRLDQACEGCHSRYWYPNQVLPPGYQAH